MDTIPPRKIIYFAVKIVQPFINFNWTSCLRCLPRRKLKPKESEIINSKNFSLDNSLINHLPTTHEDPKPLMLKVSLVNMQSNLWIHLL